MKKTLVVAVALASVGLAGCVAVPAYDAPPYAYAAPPPGVVVAPSVSFGYSRYYGGRPYYHHRHWR
jgi:hypothetical protein